MPQQETLRSFLVDLGWRSDGNGERRFIAAVEGATLKANLLASGIEAMAKSISSSLQKVSEDYRGLSALEDITKATAPTILSLGYAFKQVGLGADQAKGMLKTVADSLRTYNSANEFYYNQLGIHQDKITKAISVNTREAQQHLAAMTPAQAKQYEELTGISDDIVQLWRTRGGEMQDLADQFQGKMLDFGINQNTVDVNTRFAKDLTDLFATVDLAYGSMATQLTVALTPGVEGLKNWLDSHGPEVSTSLNEITRGFILLAQHAGGDLSTALEAGLGASGDTRLRTFTGLILDGENGIAKMVTGAEQFASALKLVAEEAALAVEAFTPTGRSMAQLGAARGQAEADFYQEQKMLEGGYSAGDIADIRRQARTGSVQERTEAQATLNRYQAPMGGAADTISGGMFDQKTIDDTKKMWQDRLKWVEEHFGGHVGSWRFGAESKPPASSTEGAAPMPLSPSQAGDQRSWWQRTMPSFLGGQNPNVPSSQATPEEAEIGGGGFRVPGTGEDIGFGTDKSTQISVGGTPVGSGNPLPIWITGIDAAVQWASGLVGGAPNGSETPAGGPGGSPGGIGPSGLGPGSGGRGAGADNTSAGQDYRYDASTAPAGSLTKLIGDAASRASGSSGAVRGADDVRRLMEGIRAGESGHGGRYDVKDDALESSWGPFQLNRRRGMGVRFEQETAAERARLGLGDLRDPRTIPLQADWVAKYLARGGSTGPWMGFKGEMEASPNWGNSGYMPANLAPAPVVSAPPSNIHIPNVYTGGQSSEYPSPTEKSASTKGLSPVIQPAPLGRPSYDQDQLFHPRSWDSDQFKSPLLYHHDFSDHSVSTTHHTNVTVNGVSDPKEAADAVASSLHDVFGKPQSITRNLQGMMT